MPFLIPAVSFLAGILVWKWFPAVIPAYALFWLIPALWFLRSRKCFSVLLALSWVFLGILYAHADRFVDPHSLVHQVDGKEKLLCGWVESLPEIRTHGRRVRLSFILKVPRTLEHGRGRAQVFLINPGKIPKAGDEVWVVGKLQKPARRTGQSFDYEKYLYSQGIDAVVYGFGWRSLKILMSHEPGFSEKLRSSIAKRILDFSSGQSAVIFQAMVLGTRGSLASELKENFFKTGTSHLLAISGLNIALAAGSFYLILIFCGVSRKTSAILAIIFTFAQVLVSGAGYPVLRAGWMAGAAFSGIALNRPGRSLNFFFFALLLVLLNETRAVYSVSFQLSFLSVFAMIVCFPWWQESRFKDLWAVPLAVFVGTFPAVLHHFEGFSTVSWLANLLAIPLFHFTLLTLLAALFFSWIPWAGNLLFKLPDLFLGLSLNWIEFCAGFPWSYREMNSPGFVWTSGYYLLFLGFVWLRFQRGRSVFADAAKNLAGLTNGLRKKWGREASK